MAAFSGHTSPRSLIIDCAVIIPFARKRNASVAKVMNGIKEGKAKESTTKNNECYFLD